MDDVVELKRSCTFLSVSLKKFHEHLHLDLKPILTVIRSAMGKVKSGGYYAVARGRKVGIYNSWSECRSSVDGFSRARYKKFYSLAEAEKFVKEKSDKEPEIGSKSNNFSRSHTSDINQQSQNEFSFDETKTVPYYAVAHGREVGIYASWAECHALVDGFDGARYKIFYNRVEAQKFVKEGTTKEPLTGEKSNIFSSNQTPSICYESGSSKSGPYYAIVRGHEVGVFDSWSKCRSLVAGFDRARYKKFLSREEAEKFVKEETFKDPWIGEKSNKFRRNHMKNESGFSVDNTDWTYAKDKEYYMNDDGWVKVFTYGACTNNGKKGARAGIGVFFGINSAKNISEPVSRNNQTNNSLEIQAISQAIKRVKDDGLRKIVIYTDSKFAINSVEDSMPKWKKKKGWKKFCGGYVINKNDFRELKDIKKGMAVKFIHIQAHKGIKGDKHADALSRKVAK
ncbi:rnhA [Lepeophtheirus salmonis]|uniref:Ribonuclease H n=1 Tax=Lepeophtheirus salmonis TaxID=72036 RepID=A0A817F9T7_LEPSM|nr:rnhA [Lepeophtheirus salmonis]CAG9476059.1 rnhA [Lepeophtheirus salmonis]